MLHQQVLDLQPGDKVAAPRGCRQCNGTGYLGRVGAYETLEMDEPLRESLFHSGNSAAFLQAAQASPRWIRLIEDAKAKAKSGLTSVNEVLRITKVSLKEESADEEEASSTVASQPAAPDTK